MNHYRAGAPRSLLRTWALALLPVALLILQGCAKREPKKPPVPRMKVGVVKAIKGDIEQPVRVSGPLRFNANTTVSAEVSAQVKSLEVEDGQVVEAGQVLLIFDDSKIKETSNQAQGNLQKNEALLAYTKIEWEKHLGLYKSGSVSETLHEQKLSAYQNASAQVKADRAALAKAMEDLSKTQVKSPVPGVVGRRFVEKGDWVSEGGRLFQIGDYLKTYIEAAVSDVDLAQLNIKKVHSGGIDTDVAVDSHPGRLFKGKLTYIQPMAGDDRLFQIRIYIDNPDMLLLQGMFARARIVAHTVKGVIRVPLSALMGQVRNGDFNTLYVVDPEQKAGLLRVKVGVNNRRFVEITEGLEEGALVVAEGKEALSAGQPIDATELTGERADPAPNPK
jgi:RND family efflux transporter MFP subunit